METYVQKYHKRGREGEREEKRTERFCWMFFFGGGATVGERTCGLKPSCGLFTVACSQSLPQITLRSKSKLLRRQSAPVPHSGGEGGVGNVTSSRVMWIVTFVRMMTLGWRKEKKKTKTGRSFQWRVGFYFHTALIIRANVDTLHLDTPTPRPPSPVTSEQRRKS